MRQSQPSRFTPSRKTLHRRISRCTLSRMIFPRVLALHSNTSRQRSGMEETAIAPQHPRRHRPRLLGPQAQFRKTSAYDDDADYRGPNHMFGTFFASATVRLAEALIGLAWDLEGEGFTAKTKPHQSRESMTQVVIYGVGRSNCQQGTHTQLVH